MATPKNLTLHVFAKTQVNRQPAIEILNGERARVSRKIFPEMFQEEDSPGDMLECEAKPPKTKQCRVIQNKITLVKRMSVRSGF